MAAEWFYISDDKENGPVSSEVLKGLASSGQIQPDSLVWKEGMPEWVVASQFNGLFPAAPAVRSIPKKPPLSSAVSKPSGKVGEGDDRLDFLNGAARTTSASRSVGSKKTSMSPWVYVAIGVPVVSFVLFSCLGGCLFLGTINSMHQAAKQAEQKGEALVSAGDDLWTAGQKETAIEKYVELLNNYVARRHVESDLPRVYGRVIDYQSEKGLGAPAKQFAVQALEDRVTVALSTPKANAVFAEAKQEYESKKAVAARSTKKDAKVASESVNSSGTPSSAFKRQGRQFSEQEMNTLFGTLVERVSVGIRAEQVLTLLGQPSQRQDQFKFTGLEELKGTEIWMWHGPNEDSFIMLLVEDGVVMRGGTQGYDIAEGFKTKLPKHLSPKDREEQKKVFEKLGIKVEDD